MTGEGNGNMNFLFASVGRRVQLLQDFRRSIEPDDRIIATDMSPYAPALQMADKRYLVPAITDKTYIDVLLKICVEEKVDALFTLIDPEIALIAENKERFEELGVHVFTPDAPTAKLCFDKFEFYKHLAANGVATPLTYGTFEEFKDGYAAGAIGFPVFVKPRTGSGSVGARRVDDETELKRCMDEEPSLIIQELMSSGFEAGSDLDADVYVDEITHKPASIFTKRKMSSVIGGANKTVSFKDPELFTFIESALEGLVFSGPIDVDVFMKDGSYYISEINPRFGGAYLHAYGAGVDFIPLIKNNVMGIANKPEFGTYDSGVTMFMFDSVVIGREDDLFDIDYGKAGNEQ